MSKIDPVLSPEDAERLEAANVAVREALADFCLWLPPETARKMAVGCLRLAAGLVALAGEMEGAGPRGASTELLLMLAEGPPDLPRAA